MRMTNKAYSLLFTGQTVGAEIPASRPGLRAWVSVYPYVKDKNRIGVAVEHRYRGVGNPTFHTLSFEIEESAVTEPTYDHDRYMSSVRRVDVVCEEGIDQSLEEVEKLLLSWSVDPALLGPLGDDYPLS